MNKKTWEKKIRKDLNNLSEIFQIKGIEQGEIKTGEKNGEYYLETIFQPYMKWKWYYDEKLIQSIRDALESEKMKLVYVSKIKEDNMFRIELLLNIDGEEKEFYVYEKDKKFCFEIKQESCFYGTSLTENVKKQVPKIIDFLESYLKEHPKNKMKFAIHEYECLYKENVLKAMIENSKDRNSYLTHPIEAFNRPFLYLRINEMLNLKKIGIYTLGDVLSMTKKDIKKVKNISKVDQELRQAILEIQEDFGPLFHIK